MHKYQTCIIYGDLEIDDNLDGAIRIAVRVKHGADTFGSKLNAMKPYSTTLTIV
jgi:hypothetical protein